MSKAIVVMGVSGSGKSSLARALAAQLNCKFIDGDEFHPRANIVKMARGEPLTDADRQPFLASVGAVIKAHSASRGGSLLFGIKAKLPRPAATLAQLPVQQTLSSPGHTDVAG